MKRNEPASFIEVTGTARVSERVVEYRADLSVTVRAANTQSALEEVADLRARCVQTLKQAGLRESELTEGGGEVWRPWFWRKKPGREASHKILISCTDASRLFRAFVSLEPLFAEQRHTLAVAMRSPRFESDLEERRKAHKQALAAARAKADTVAEESGLKITGVSQVEELDERKQRSGSYGDEDWGGSYLATAVAGEDEAEDETQRLGGATRDVVVRFRVRFSVEAL